jgi:uncharacterized protein YyaL (SSP411 family)
MALNLFYLSIIFDEYEWGDRSKKIIASLSSATINYPTSFGVWASIIQLIVAEINEIVIAGNDAFSYLPKVLERYIPNKVLQATQTEECSFPLLKGKFKEENSGFFVCKTYVCKEPVYDLKNFFAKL